MHKFKLQELKWRILMLLRNRRARAGAAMAIAWSTFSTFWLLQKHGFLNPVHVDELPHKRSTIGTPTQTLPSQHISDAYILWDHQEIYFQHCRTNLIGNATWGKQMAPYVDKVDAKDIIRKMSSVEIIPTIAFLDKSNVS